MNKLPCMGEFLVREGIWRSNPLRWLRGPKLDIRSRVPRRISPEVMRGLWEAAAAHRYGYHRSMWVTLLSVFYGTTMRYLHVADPQLHQTVKLHPINEILMTGGVA